LVVHRADHMCEPALKLPENADPAGGVVMEPNATLTLSSETGGIIVVLDGALGLIRESPTLTGNGKVAGAMLQGGVKVGDSFFDVFAELSEVGTFHMGDFFDIMLHINAGGATHDVPMHLVMGPGGYTGHVDPALEVGGMTFTSATLTLNDP